MIYVLYCQLLIVNNSENSILSKEFHTVQTIKEFCISDVITIMKENNLPSNTRISNIVF